MIDYDAIEAAFLLQRDRMGVIVGKEMLPLETLRFIVDAQGKQHEVDFSSDPRRKWEEGYEDGAWVLRCGDMIELVAIREVVASH